jgi:CRISPR-associated endonuclease/helicase Cas3
MRVILVSQCTKSALVETRRIIDQFAERKGDCVWQTDITEHGLDTLKKLLKVSARKNTAVACHLFRGRFDTELLWIVGNSKKFRLDGTVPTNLTQKDVLRSNDENEWKTSESIAILSSIAALFHDFGKANDLFQAKLRPKSKRFFEPFRHEWISVLLFKNFVGKRLDREWLKHLSEISDKDEAAFLNDLAETYTSFKCIEENPLKHLPPIAKFIAWLIMSHHRLPQHPGEHDKQKYADQIKKAPFIDKINTWLDSDRLSAQWNAIHHLAYEWSENEKKQITSFKKGLPVRSTSWKFAAQKAAKKALKYYDMLERNWFEDRFSMHLARASLMFADHYWSNEDSEEPYKDPKYEAYANTTPEGHLKQQLDEHHIGVAFNSYFIAKALPHVRDSLPAIFHHQGFKKRNKHSKYVWQDQAFELAKGLRSKSQKQGFFGINLASTGCGKTLANARIMYGLNNAVSGSRFTIALGLRVLTLQTGQALQKRLRLKDDDVAVLVGSSAFKELYEMQKNGSESGDRLVDIQDYISYEGCLDDGHLRRWLESSPDLHKLVSAPILVSTIDYLMPATEGCRGGRQIGPILRLLTSDLVLDEPDDFDVEDLHAVCRLINFAGVFGSRVIISSATLPPSIVKSFYQAYASGRKQFNLNCSDGIQAPVGCAWFDEFGVKYSEPADSESFMNAHGEFVEKRIAHLEQQPILRKSVIMSFDTMSNGSPEYMLAKTLHKSIYPLHQHHHQKRSESGHTISFGLVRMANINPMIKVLKTFIQEPAQNNFAIHFCVYHSRFPLLVRSNKEHILDCILDRHQPDQIWHIPEIDKAISNNLSAQHHIFIVFATPVAEVGRDHDYDWAIIEPSSMRSIIQTAGRVQRHRCIPPAEPNVLLLKYNFRALSNTRKDDEVVAFLQPGFETSTLKLKSHDLDTILRSEEKSHISSIPRLRSTENYDGNNLVDLEHERLRVELFSNQDPQKCTADLWWRNFPDWCGELQRRKPFRKQIYTDQEYFYYYKDDDTKPTLHQWSERNDCPLEVHMTNFTQVKNRGSASGIYPWIDCLDIDTELRQLAEKLELRLNDTAMRFSRITLDELKDGNAWCIHPWFGFYRE